MRKMSKASPETVPSTPKTKDGAHPRRRKNKGHDEKTPESTGSDVRQRRSKKEVLEAPEARVFDVRTLQTGDKFTFLAPGKGKRTYICTVKGSDVLFERDDKHTYTRNMQELRDIIKACSLECTMINS